PAPSLKCSCLGNSSQHNCASKNSNDQAKHVAKKTRASALYLVRDEQTVRLSGINSYPIFETWAKSHRCAERRTPIVLKSFSSSVLNRSTLPERRSSICTPIGRPRDCNRVVCVALIAVQACLSARSDS